MSAGVADFVIEQGADWAVQVYWQSEQTQQAIPAQGPMDMDIVSGLTGQRLIRLDDGANGGIMSDGAMYGIVQLEIPRDQTINFMAGNYVYDLYAYSIGPPLQRVRLLRGSVSVAPAITDLGVQMGQIVNPGVLPPDIILHTALDSANNVVTVTFDNTNPTNQHDNVETGIPQRAGLTGVGNFPSGAAVHYIGSKGPGPFTDPQAGLLNAGNINAWLSTDAVITVTYSDADYGLVVSRVESIPGNAPAPPVLLMASADTGDE